MMVKTGVNGLSAVRLTIQAPVMPTSTSISGITQQVDAIIDDTSAMPISLALSFFFDAAATGCIVVGERSDCAVMTSDFA